MLAESQAWSEDAQIYPSRAEDPLRWVFCLYA